MGTGSGDFETHSIVLALHEPPRKYVKMWSSRFPFVRWRLSFTLHRKIGVHGECLDSRQYMLNPGLFNQDANIHVSQNASCLIKM